MSEKDEMPFMAKIGSLALIIVAFFVLKYFATNDASQKKSVPNELVNKDLQEVLPSSLNIEVSSMTQEHIDDFPIVHTVTEHYVQITSEDDKQFTLNKIVFNKRNTEKCTVNFLSGRAEGSTAKEKRTYLLGDVEKIALPRGCGDEILAVDIDSDRGEFSYHFERQ